MKRSTILSLTFLSATVLFSYEIHAQDYNRWSLPEGARMRLGKGNVRHVAWSPDRKLVAVGGSVGIWLYDAHTGAEISLITGHSFRVNAVAFSPDGLTLASGSRDATVRLWDVDTEQDIRSLTGDNFRSLAYSPDGTTLATGSAHKAVWLWDVATGQNIRALTGHTDPINSVVFSPDGKTLASAGYDGTILLWDVSSRAVLQPLAADFDGDGNVGFTEFLQFVAKYGLRWGDAGYDARFDLDGDGEVGSWDWRIFGQSFGRGG